MYNCEVKDFPPVINAVTMPYPTDGKLASSTSRRDFFFIFSRVVFHAVPWLTERLEEANDKLYCTAQQTISRPQMAANNNTFIIYIAKPLGNVKV